MRERRIKGVHLPEVYLAIRDNCVGQNKSNVTIHFDCWLSLSFYKRVLIVYLIPGHSHMMSDRVVAWAKQGLENKNLFVPKEIVEAMNGVKGIDAQFIEYLDRLRESWEGWGGF